MDNMDWISGNAFKNPILSLNVIIGDPHIIQEFTICFNASFICIFLEHIQMDTECVFVI